MKREKILIVLTGCLVMVACVTKNNNLDYLSDYRDAVQPKQFKMLDSEHAQPFENLSRLFSDLKQANTEAMIRQTYAQNLYFNDTLHTFTGIELLSEYLIDGANRVDEITVSFEDISKSAENYYLHWTMQMKFKAIGKNINSESIGISQIRFNEQGKIIFQQDFWDNTSGVFGHLPLLGSMITQVKKTIK